MGTIKSGPMMSTRGSIAGYNYYKRMGIQCVRAKPTISPDYEPSDSQTRQRSAFGAGGVFIKTSPFMRWLVDYGWGAVSNGKGRTNQNQIMSEIMRASSRDEFGNRLPADEREDRRELLETNPAEFFSTYCSLTKSKYVGLAPVSIVRTGSGNIIVQYSGASVRAYRQYLGGLNQDFLNDLDLAVVVSYRGYSLDDVEPFLIQELAYNVATDVYQANVDANMPSSVPEVQVSVFFPLFGNVEGADWDRGAITQVSKWTLQDPSPRLTSATLNGADILTPGDYDLEDGDLVVVTGQSMELMKLQFDFVGGGSTPFSNLVTTSVDTPTRFEGVVKQAMVNIEKVSFVLL